MLFLSYLSGVGHRLNATKECLKVPFAICLALIMTTVFLLETLQELAW